MRFTSGTSFRILLNVDFRFQNGWDVNDMFERNEELGVGSTYDDTLADYTVQIIKNNTKDFK